MTEVMAATEWKTNGDMIADVASLGYLRKEDVTLDPTYGNGRWWTRWRPTELIGTDIVPARSPFDGRRVNFCDLPFLDDQFDAVAFDPPYKLNGTPTAEVDGPYGVDVVASQSDRHALIRAGITETARVLKPGGIELLKCQAQVNGGKVRWQEMEFTRHAETVGLELIDMLLMLGHFRPQPAGRRQVHARRNVSSLLVFRKVR